MSDRSMHLAKWMVALEQVTIMHAHLVKCPHQVTTWSSAISIFSERHLAKGHIAALSQVINHTGLQRYSPKTFLQK